MPIPDTTSQSHDPVVEGQGLVTVDLGDAAQAFGSADGVFDFDAAAGMGAVIGALRVGQGSGRLFLLRRGLQWSKFSGATSSSRIKPRYRKSASKANKSNRPMLTSNSFLSSW